MTNPPIYFLPAALQRYKTEAINNPQEHQCPLCWRVFSEKHNPSDPEEVPCRPIEIVLCHYVFGD